MRHTWPEKRKRYTERRIDELERRTLQTRVQVDERHLRALRNSQVLFHNEIVRLLRKQQEGVDITAKEWSGVVGIMGAATKSIMTERTILGMPTKVHKIKDQEVLKDLQEMMGYTKVSFWQKYTLSKQLLESTNIKAIERHIELLKQYTDYVEETGDETVVHPFWD